MLTVPQLLAIGVFGLTLAAFVWDRVRYDVVALASLIGCALLGLIAPADAFAGFGNPAVITVAGVLVLSHTLGRSGAVQLVGERVGRITESGTIQIAMLCLIGATLSAFMNNVGALAIVMPVALACARRGGWSPALVLMPLSFATMLGGMCTLIGTPPNLLAAGFRARYAEAPFAFFDFAPVGLAVTLAGVAYLVLAGRWLLPHDRAGQRQAIDRFDVGHYVTEVRVPEASSWVGRTLAAIEDEADDRLLALSLLRRELRARGLRGVKLAPGDDLLVQAEAELLQELVRKGDLELVAAHSSAGEKVEVATRAEIETIEVVVTPRGAAQGQTARRLRLRSRFGVNLLALSREGRAIAGRVRNATLRAGDVLLLEGEGEALGEAVRELGLLPLADRRIALEPFRVWTPVAVFAAAIALVAGDVVGAPVAFALAVLAMLALRLVPLRELYEGVDWPVIVLLGAMIPVGGVLESTGLAQLAAERIAALGGAMPPRALLAVVLVATMAVTPMLNNAATVIVMAPIAIGVAQQVGVNPDAYVMAVAIGASCDFLTPFGHQNNTLILAPGGYRFSDYWKLGLPLDAIVVAISVSLLPLVFPLG